MDRFRCAFGNRSSFRNPSSYRTPLVSHRPQAGSAAWSALLKHRGAAAIGLRGGEARGRNPHDTTQTKPNPAPVFVHLLGPHRTVAEQTKLRDSSR